MASPQVNVDLNANIQIGTRVVPLHGRLSSEGTSSGIIDLRYRAESLDEAICLGGVAEAFNASISCINLAAENVANLANGAIAKIRQMKVLLENAGIAPPLDKNNLLSQLYNIISKIEVVDEELVTYTGSADVVVFVTEVALRGRIENGVPAKPLELAIALAFQFEAASLFNISVKSAGIRFTCTIPKNAGS